MSTVFISYETNTGLQLAKHLKKSLLKHEISSFVAADDIDYGEEPMQTIESNLKDCKYFIMILTITALKSSEVRKEFFKAKEMGKNIIPCIKEGLEDYVQKEFEEILKFQYAKFENKEDLANNILEMVLQKELEEIKNSLRRIKKVTRKDIVDSLLEDLVMIKNEIFFWLTEPEADPNRQIIFRFRHDKIEEEKNQELEKIKRNIIDSGLSIIK